MSPEDLKCGKPLCVAAAPHPGLSQRGGTQADSQKLSPCRTCGMAPGGAWSGGWGCVSFPGRVSCGAAGREAWGGWAPNPPSSVAMGFQPLVLSPPHPTPRADDNSNQSSIADASPIKQENSSNSSPAPEPNSAVPGEGTDAKADEAQADGKELPGTEDASDEQNSQSSVENSVNSSEKVERQPSGDAGLPAEMSAASQDLEGVPPSKKMKLETSQQNSEEM